MEFETFNLEDMVRSYDFKNNHNLLLNVSTEMDIDGKETTYIVVYDISEMIEKPTDVDDFFVIVHENGLDENEFEIDRSILVYG